MVNKKTFKILYIGAGLDIKTLLQNTETHIDILHLQNTKPNTSENKLEINSSSSLNMTRIYVCVDSLPRSSDQTEVDILYTKYKQDFAYELISICETHGFELQQAIELDTTFSSSKVGIYKRIYYYCFGYNVPDYINPELWVFTNYKTHETIRYYISTNIEVNQHELLLHDIRDSDILYINTYIPSCVLFDIYHKKHRKLVCTEATSFQLNSITKNSILKILNYNINFFKSYIRLFADKTYTIFDSFNDIKHIAPNTPNASI
jgi:hypothetical protein